MHALEMPQPLAGRSIKGKKRIGEEIVAETVASVKIENRAARRHIQNPAPGIERHSGPVICGARLLPRIGRPGFGALLARMRDRMEPPAQRPRAHVERANVARRSGMSLRIPPPNNDEVLIDQTRRGQRDRLLRVIATQVFAQIEPAILAEVRQRFARCRIERVEVVQHAREQARVRAIAPPGKPSRGLRVFEAGIEAPDKFPRRSIERDDLALRRASVENPPNDEGVGFNVALFSRIELPRHLQPSNVGAVDLRKPAVVIAVDPPVVNRPVDVALCCCLPRRTVSLGSWLGGRDGYRDGPDHD